MTPAFATPYARPLLAGLAWDLVRACNDCDDGYACDDAPTTARRTDRGPPTRQACDGLIGAREPCADCDGKDACNDALAPWLPLPAVARWWLDPATPTVCSVCLSRPCLDWCPTLTPALGGACDPLRVAAGGATYDGGRPMSDKQHVVDGCLTYLAPAAPGEAPTVEKCVTVRNCLDCHALVVGGPVRCGRCAGSRLRSRRRKVTATPAPGQIVLRYGPPETNSQPDMCFWWGDAAPDGKVLGYLLSQALVSSGVLAELERAGYDLRTFRLEVNRG